MIEKLKQPAEPLNGFVKNVLQPLCNYLEIQIDNFSKSEDPVQKDIDYVKFWYNEYKQRLINFKNKTKQRVGEFRFLWNQLD